MDDRVEVTTRVEVERREHAIRHREAKPYAADGSVTLSAVNETLGTDLKGDGFETLSGVVLNRLGGVPAVGDTIEAAGYVVR